VAEGAPILNRDIDKRSLSERDICTKFITPALRRAGWDVMSQIREEVSFTKGRIIVRGKLDGGQEPSIAAGLALIRVPERIAERTKACAGLPYAVDQIKKLPGRAAKPVKLGHDDDIAGSKPGHELCKLRSISARVSTRDQNLTGQIDALKAAGAGMIYREKVSGARFSTTV
jgi:hypothetical protein